MSSPTYAAAARPATFRMSRALSVLCLVLVVAGPVLTFLLLVLSPGTATVELGLTPSEGDEAGFTLGFYERAVVVVVGLIPIAFVTYGLVRARRCFRSFGRGEFFTANVVGDLRAFSAGIALWVVAGWLSEPLMSLLLTLPREEKQVSVTFGLNGFMTLLFAGIVWQIADIMRRAAAIAEENAQFV